MKAVSNSVKMGRELEEEKALNQSLIINQDKLKQIEEDKNKRIKELEEQVRDLMFFLDAQSKVEASANKEEIQSGQVVIEQKKPKQKSKKK